MATNHDGRPILEDEELHESFAALFPQGWFGADELAELAPRGWAESGLVAVFHPSAAQIHEESARIRRNLSQLFKPKPDAPQSPPERTLAEVEAEHVEAPIEAERECQELVGLCLWDIFSDNHEVTDEEGRLFDLGSLRSSGGFLAEVLNKQDGPKPPPKLEPAGMFADMFAPKNASPEQANMFAMLKQEMFGDGGYTYLDFYMGTHQIASSVDLMPVYRMIFRRLRARGCDWKYAFPRLYAVDMRPLSKASEEQKREESGEPEWAEYDPSAAFEQDAEEEERDRKLGEMRESLDEAHREAVEASLDREPPTTVRAYEAEYGQFPEGWPPEAS